MALKSLKPACSAKKKIVRLKDLPLSCPMPNGRLWDAHPKVFLPIEEEGEVTCPYCGTHYLLEHDTA